jgi:hypothetical protein
MEKRPSLPRRIAAEGLGFLLLVILAISAGTPSAPVSR